MHRDNTFSCFLIGADSLLIECGEALLRAGHDIRGVITATPRITAWARKQGLRHVDLASDYRVVLDEQPFDYLFSITHLALIPADVLARPRRAAINFHDGPLPAYAGLNAPAWALVNRETRYGITWHVMNAGVDTGDILKQKLFDITPGEVSLTLNTKCFEAAIEGFQELISELAAGTAQPQPQDAARRSYFAKHQRPAAACVLDWRQPAEQLEALVRALDFGRYPNPLGSAKLLLAGEPFVVTRTTAHADSSGAAPGTIASLDERELRVATGDGTLSITGLATTCGRELPISELAARFNFAVGQRFDLLDVDASVRITDFNSRACKAEAFWTRRLETLDAALVPYAAAATAAGNAPLYAEARVAIPASFSHRFDAHELADAVTAALGIYLARTGEKATFDVAFRDQVLRDASAGLESLVSNHVAVRFNFVPTESFAAAFQRTTAELTDLRRRGPWLRDLLGRAPELHSRPELAAGRALPIRVEVRDDAAAFEPGAGHALTLVIWPEARVCRLIGDTNVVSSDVLATIQRQFATLLQSLGEDLNKPVGAAALLTTDESRKLLVDWNSTALDYRTDVCIHDLFGEQVARTPEAVAVVFEDQSLTYRELNARANQLAAHLRELGIGPDRLVGVCLERSIELVVAILATHKAGGAYVPLDPAYPADRIAFMVEDAAVPVILTQDRLVAELPEHDAVVVRVDADWPTIARHSTENVPSEAQPQNLAYVIYTSGSTGKPKGVMIEHRNVVNFFAGMDDVIEHDPPGVWLAVTSLSFDISVLELLYTLARGFKVVVYLDRERVAAPVAPAIAAKPMDFSLFYFSSDEAESGDNKYRLLMEGSRFADEHGFKAVWTPERHFHAFGGLYPNPAVTGAAVAAITKHVEIRAGSIVLPLHHPIRVAEAWSVVDNLSNGRVGISVASGWQPNDFVLMPQNFKDAKNVMFRDTETIKRLWRGETVEFPGATGQPVAVRTLPRPVQRELPVWVTTAGNIETYKMAGQIGANLLTHLLGQSVEELAPKIAVYRQARAEAGFDPDAGVVSLMLHTFLGDDEAVVRETVREPLRQYLASSLSLLKQYAWAFPAFKRPANAANDAGDDLAHLTDAERDAMLDHAFERYYVTSGLFGRPGKVVELVNQLKAIGVNDIACLIDFGVPTQTVLDSLGHLNQLRELSNSGAGETSPRDFSLPAQILRHGVTHLQCTPSMARMLTTSDDSREALRTVKHMMVGGEAFPVDVARELKSLIRGTVTNMYGPTETTIWSTTQRVDEVGTSIPIGRPIANTQLYILDAQGQPVPPGLPGEFFIAGEGVVRGYLNRPELTAERFVADPFSSQPGARMYRTGDLARYRADGVVEFLGRTDHQVKIRGHRIELGEIETRINEHALVAECVVVAREDTPGDQRLVAYLVATGSTSPDHAELRKHLRESLPEYMLPSHFVTLDVLPLTPNGKIDRKALPAPDATVAAVETVYVAPQGELESQLARLWCETLGREQVGRDDNFFDIGGHSLLVVRLHRKLAAALSQPVALTDLYRFPTIRALVEHLSGDNQGEALQAGADRGQKRREAMQRRRRPVVLGSLNAGADDQSSILPNVTN